MRVFVTGTGRCGTTTFSMACRHITNFTCGHETMVGRVTPARLDYPDGHIEVDPHLAWMIGPMVERHPEAYFVHLQREKEQVVDSWRRRGILPHSGPAPLIDVICQAQCKRLPPQQYGAALGLLYDMVNANLRVALQRVRSTHIWLHEANVDFPRFWRAIDAEGDMRAALAEFDRRYNASRR